MSALSQQLYGGGVEVKSTTVSSGQNIIMLPHRLDTAGGLDVQSYTIATLYFQVHLGAVHRVWAMKTQYESYPLTSPWVDIPGLLGSEDAENTLVVGSYSLELDLVAAKYLRVMIRGDYNLGAADNPVVSAWLSVGGIS
jgi:hypothetical protein